MNKPLVGLFGVRREGLFGAWMRQDVEMAEWPKELPEEPKDEPNNDRAEEETDEPS
jgi:hypothetical protein